MSRAKCEYGCETFDDLDSLCDACREHRLAESVERIARDLLKANPRMTVKHARQRAQVMVDAATRED
jgi:hypothetical protein